MKGLILNSMDRKQEAYVNARKGVRYDLTSHVSKCPLKPKLINLSKNLQFILV